MNAYTFTFCPLLFHSLNSLIPKARIHTRVRACVRVSDVCGIRCVPSHADTPFYTSTTHPHEQLSSARKGVVLGFIERHSMAIYID